ncbi:SAM-dependent RNA methyltransferase [Mycena latifolia]|nr:SAM-dependent RNA methyltransferase [Mycena latifolia]
MGMLAGPSAQINFTHLSKASRGSLSAVFAPQVELADASCHQTGVLDLIQQHAIPLEKVYLLDPKTELQLSPEDGDRRFKWFLFGGILGDDPPRDRTSELRVLGFPTQPLGPVQMTTDTVLGATKLVVDDKIPLDKIPYVDFPTIVFNPKESVEMPFRYITDGTEPKLPSGMSELLHEDLNKNFDF